MWVDEFLGIDVFLMKPLEMNALAETIERVLSRVRAERVFPIATTPKTFVLSRVRAERT